MNKEQRYRKLQDILKEAGSAVVALSGGTDSVFLVHTASGIKDFRLLAVTVKTPYMFASEVSEAEEFCKRYGINHRQVTINIPDVVSNNPIERCYLCKREVMKHITEIASGNAFPFVFDGTNVDDTKEYRPGLKALEEYGIRSPLMEAGLTKTDIRALSKEADLNTWDKPSNACLLTRFPHGTRVEEEDLRRAEKAELLLSNLGLPGSRIRVHGEVARIECRKEYFELLFSEKMKDDIVSGVKSLGYKYITIDLEGYRTGSMNKTVE